MKPLRIKNLKKKFKDTVAINGVNLEIEEGKITGIIGRSGSGKSTLLRGICKLNSIDNGDILIKGININDYKDSQLTSLVGMVFQQFNLFSNMTVLRNVMYALMNVRKMKKEEAEYIAASMCCREAIFV